MSWLLPLLACTTPGPTTTQPSSLILISLNNVRWDHTSLSGYRHDTTPTLSRLADLPGAVSFQRAYAPASWSLAAHASLFTGLDALSHGLGFTRTRLPVKQPTLAALLAEQGFRTAAFTSGPHLHPTTLVTRGFETHRHEQDFAPLTPQIEPALAWVAEAREAGDPYFLFVQGHDAVPPYTAPAVFSEMFVEDYDGDLHVGRQRSAECRVIGTRVCVPPISSLQRQRGEEADLSDEHPHLIGHYDSALRAGDYGLNRLLHGIEQAGALDDAILVVLSDHGRSFASGRYPDPAPRAEQLYHVPLIIRRPDGAPAAAWDGAVSLTDVMPTVAAQLGVSLPGPVDGVDLSTVFDDPAAAPSERAVRSAELCCDAVQTADWSLLGDRRTQADWEPTTDTVPPWGERTWRLYATGSTEDVAAEHPDVVDTLRAHLDGWPEERTVDAAGNIGGTK